MREVEVRNVREGERGGGCEGHLPVIKTCVIIFPLMDSAFGRVRLIKYLKRSKR